LYYHAGVSLRYTDLPEIWDFEGDDVTMSYNLRNASSFMKVKEVSKNRFTIVVDLQQSRVGNYSAKVILTDNNKNPLSTVYNIELEVFDDPYYVPEEKILPNIQKVKPLIV
jgi:hypothetical protein